VHTHTDREAPRARREALMAEAELEARATARGISSAVEEEEAAAALSSARSMAPSAAAISASAASIRAYSEF